MALREYEVPGHGVALSVRDTAGGRPAIVALHGLASNARWWDLVARRLAPDHRVVALDQRGHGRAEGPQGGYDFASCRGDVVAAMDHLGLGQAVVVGHSWGATVALDLAAQRPERVLGLVMIDGGVTDLKAVFGPTWERAEEAMAPPELTGLTAEQVRQWVEVSSLADATDVDTATQILLGNFEAGDDGALHPRLRRDRHLQIARHLFDYDNLSAVARLRCPVLLLMASHPAQARSPEARLAALKRSGVTRALEILGEAGAIVWISGEHDLPVQRPDEVANAIAAFVASLS